VNLFKRKPKPAKPAEELTPKRIEFVGEQTGQTEDELKTRFVPALQQSKSIIAAYLACVYYGEPSNYSVALCIRSTAGLDDRLRRRLASIFSEIFRSDAYLDIIFIRDDQEQQLRSVCNAFYQVA
jgi:hypothetical protein